ncbi:MAG: response regulator [Candidatus Pacebacteria bacterium]|nr:response regulator [Candidatus Paceibacterota bacterium]
MNVLIIDDCALEMRPMMEMWKDEIHLPITWKYAESSAEGMRLIEQEPIGLILMDGHLIGEYGHEVVAKIRAQGITIPICMFSSSVEQNTLGEQAGAEYSVNKAMFSIDDFETRDHLAAIINLAFINAPS